VEHRGEQPDLGVLAGPGAAQTLPSIARAT
jgi:hypothetical protein